MPGALAEAEGAAVAHEPPAGVQVLRGEAEGPQQTEERESVEHWWAAAVCWTQQPGTDAADECGGGSCAESDSAAESQDEAAALLADWSATVQACQGRQRRCQALPTGAPPAEAGCPAALFPWVQAQTCLSCAPQPQRQERWMDDASCAEHRLGSVVVQLEAHPVVYFVVRQGDVVFVDVVPLLNSNLLRTRSSLCCHQLFQVAYGIVLAACPTSLPSGWSLHREIRVCRSSRIRAEAADCQKDGVMRV